MEGGRERERERERENTAKREREIKNSKRALSYFFFLAYHVGSLF